MSFFGVSLSHDDKNYLFGAAVFLALLLCAALTYCYFRCQQKKQGKRTASNHDGPRLTFGRDGSDRDALSRSSRSGSIMSKRSVRRRSSMGICTGPGRLSQLHSVTAGCRKEAARLSASNGRSPHGVTSTKLDGAFFNLQRGSHVDDDAVACVRTSEVVSSKRSSIGQGSEPVRPKLARENTSYGIEVSPCGAGIRFRATSMDSDDGDGRCRASSMYSDDGSGAPQQQQREWLYRQAGSAVSGRSQDGRSLKSIRLDGDFFDGGSEGGEGGEGGEGEGGDTPRGVCRVSISDSAPPPQYAALHRRISVEDEPIAPPTLKPSTSSILTERSMPTSGLNLSERLRARRGKSPGGRQHGLAESSRTGPMQTVSLEGCFFESSLRQNSSRRGSCESLPNSTTRRRSMENFSDFAAPTETSAPAGSAPSESEAASRPTLSRGPSNSNIPNSGGPLARRASRRSLVEKKSRADSTSSVASNEGSYNVCEGSDSAKKKSTSIRGSKSRVTFGREGSESHRGSLEQGSAGGPPPLLRKSSSQGLSWREESTGSKRGSLMGMRKSSARDLFSGGQMPDGSATPRTSTQHWDLVRRNTPGLGGVSADL